AAAGTASPRRQRMGELRGASGNENTDLDRRCQPCGVGGKLACRACDEPAQSWWQAERVKRPPVNRYGDGGANQRQRFGGAQGAEMTGAKPRPPAPDRQQGEVDWAERGHAGE